VEDGASLFRPDFLTPRQWQDFHRNGDDPVKNLLRALLELSLRDATGVRRQGSSVRRARRSPLLLAREGAKRSKQVRRDAREARLWIFDDGSDGPFSFVNVCEALGIAARRCVSGCGSGWLTRSTLLPAGPKKQAA